MATEPETTKPPTSAAELQQQYALDRTVLANERTYAAWIRTGLGALVAGVGLALCSILAFVGIVLVDR